LSSVRQGEAISLREKETVRFLGPNYALCDSLLGQLDTIRTAATRLFRLLEVS
jgi:hypothetical protein